MSNDAYLRQPSIAADRIVFLTEDDLFEVAATGGRARRLTVGLGEASNPVLSPDGGSIAYTGRDEHHSEAWVLPGQGGQARRLTYFGADAEVRGWTPDGRILVVTAAHAPLRARSWAYAQPVDGGPPERLAYGPVRDVAFGPDDQVVLGRMTSDPARWKRYRGGRAGQLWTRIDGTWRRLVELAGNLASPMWVGERVYFLSDHEGIGNIYSCDASGSDIRRHTDHGTYYVRTARSDGTRIVYAHAADIWCFDPAADRTELVEIEVRGPRAQRRRRHVPAEDYLAGCALRPDGSGFVLQCRGKLFETALFAGAVIQLGSPQGVHYRYCRYIDAERLLVYCDDGGEDHFEIVATSGTEPPRRLETAGAALTEVVDVAVSPVAAVAAVATVNGDLVIVDLDTDTATVADHGEFGPLHDVCWSADGSQIAYAYPASSRTQQIRCCAPATGAVVEVTRPEFSDSAPVFDPEGKYLAFLSRRLLDPVADEVYFDFGFPMASRPYVVTLSAEERSPLRPIARGMRPTDQSREDAQGQRSVATQPAAPAQPAQPAPPAGPLRIDAEGIADRAVAVPVPNGSYQAIAAIPGKLLMLNRPIAGTIAADPLDDKPASGALQSFELAEGRHEVLAGGVDEFWCSRDGSTVLYLAGKRLRAVAAGEKAPEGSEADKPGRQGGIVDLERIQVEVDPPAEWRQMFLETWRQQREHFWVDDMSGVDWSTVRDRYMPLVERCSTRAELGDLIWELQGELGTSHAYELGGDRRRSPQIAQGSLGLDTVFDRDSRGWRVVRVVVGDSWHPGSGGACTEPAAAIQIGDEIVSINGRHTDDVTPPGALLVGQANRDVSVGVRGSDGGVRSVLVTARAGDGAARYRDWVRGNRDRVHAVGDASIGYVHVPDMVARGFAEFHRSYLAEIDHPALIVDVRHNGGGNVSALLLAKLAARRTGYEVSRWQPTVPYPPNSPGGPLVAIADGDAGSDGDIFTHSFKQLGLGPVVGTRTWGGVIGIWPRHPLVDGTLVSQPEFAFWFADAKWGVENYGVAPDVEVEILPDDWAAGRDPQLDKAIELALAALEQAALPVPDLSRRPRLPLPVLPPRGSAT